METFNHDIPAAALAASLVEGGLARSKVVIVPTGASKRSCREDVARDDEAASLQTDPYYVIRTPKEGLYDMLPEGLFHAPAVREQGGGVAPAIEAMKQRRAEEKSARDFFVPFEIPINDAYISLALLESSFSHPDKLVEVAHVFEVFWPVLQVPDARQSAVFTRCIPFLHEMRDDHARISTLLEELLLVAVNITMAEPQVLSQPVHPGLGDACLGIDAVNDGCAFGEYEMVITIGPVNIQRQSVFFPGGTDHLILTQITEYLLPADMEVRIELELGSEDRRFQLCCGDTMNCSLGFDTYL